MIGAGWRAALLAGWAIESAVGLLAAAAAFRANPGDQAMTMYLGCTLAAGVADMVVIPGWVWASGPLAMRPLLLRAGLLVLTLMVAVWAAVTMAFAGIAFVLILVPGVAVVGFVGCFALAGAVAGLGAWLGGRVDLRPGLVRGRVWSHVVPGVLGSLTVFGAATAIDWLAAPMQGGGFQPLPASTWVLPPAALVIGGGLHHLLLSRDGRRSGAVLPQAGTMARRGVCVCATSLLLSGLVLVVA